MPIKYVESLVGIFLNLIQLQTRENYWTTLLAIGQTILEVDQIDSEKDNKKWLNKLDDIEKTTHQDLDIPLAKAEAIVTATPVERWGRTVQDVKTNHGKRLRLPNKPEVKVFDLYQYLKQTQRPIIQAVSNVVKDYSMDIRFHFGERSGSGLKWMDDDQDKRQ